MVTAEDKVTYRDPKRFYMMVVYLLTCFIQGLEVSLLPVIASITISSIVDTAIGPPGSSKRNLSKHV